MELTNEEQIRIIMERIGWRQSNGEWVIDVRKMAEFLFNELYYPDEKPKTS